MVQKSVTGAMGSKEVSVSDGKRPTSNRSEGRMNPQGQSKKSSATAHTKRTAFTPNSNEYNLPNSTSASSTAAKMNRKPAKKLSVELPPKPQYRQTTYTQPAQIHSQTRVTIPQPQKSEKSRTARSSSSRQSERRQQSRITPFLYVIRLLILGVGIAALSGTLLAVLDPTSRITTAPATGQKIQPELASDALVVQASALKLSQEILPLKTVVQQLAAKNANLLPGVFFVDLDNGSYLDVNGDLTFAAASMIKFPLLVAFFQEVDAGKIRLDEQLILKKELIGGGSGEMQYKTPGTKFTALETATKMITISDNTATNLLIARLGGIESVNKRFQSWGLMATQIRNPLPDLPGTNTTSPRDLANLMALVDEGKLLKLKSRDRLLDIMQRTVTATLLPRGLGAGATIAHKTGDIGKLVGDVGLVDMPNGKRYIAVAMVRRPHNDGRAQELIRQISRAAYQQLNKPSVSQIMPTTPFITTTPRGGTEVQGSRGASEQGR